MTGKPWARLNVSGETNKVRPGEFVWSGYLDIDRTCFVGFPVAFRCPEKKGEEASPNLSFWEKVLGFISLRPYTIASESGLGL